MYQALVSAHCDIRVCKLHNRTVTRHVHLAALGVVCRGSGQCGGPRLPPSRKACARGRRSRRTCLHLLVVSLTRGCARLRARQHRLHRIRVGDPACQAAQVLT